MDPQTSYPPLADYALIGDSRSSALVGRSGSIDWCCMPRFQVGSCFGRVLDWDRGGYCSIVPTEDADVTRSYIEDTLVLVTTFRTGSGEAQLVDCFTVPSDGEHAPQLLRVVEGQRGRVTFDVRVTPRFDYGEVPAWIRKRGPDVHTAIGGDDALFLSGDLGLDQPDAHTLMGKTTVRAGERARLSLLAVRPEEVEPSVPGPPRLEELDRRLASTIDWWREWASQVTLSGPDARGARRSAIVLKALADRSTGAIVAAPTTSLPEQIGGSRNWDYRYSWIRDSHLTVRSLTELGCAAEADGFRRFVERSAAGEAEALQVMYGPDGSRRFTEIELDLEGYRGSRPVRVGNAAARQAQHDIYGYVVDVSWRWHQRGDSPDDDYWRFLVSVINAACERWHRPDRGIWEVRGAKRHFVHSKVMCWVAMDRGIALAESSMRAAPTDHWRATRDEIRAAVESDGFDERRGTFVQAFDRKQMDAALLLLPEVGFVAYDDPRMVATVDRIIDELEEDGFLLRYRGDDGIEGEEAAFLACTFWLAECLARQGRLPEARRYFDRGVSAGNELGLFSEETDPASGELLGNFPQGLSHLSHIAAAVALSRAGEAIIGSGG